jgi:hypothetical protein
MGMPRIVTPDGRVLQHWRPQDLEEFHARLKASIRYPRYAFPVLAEYIFLVRTPKSKIEGLPPRRLELAEVALPGDGGGDDEDEDEAISRFDSRTWFDAKALKLIYIEKALHKAYRQRDKDRIIKLEQDKKEILSTVYQHTTRIKRKPILDYLLSLPRDHKVVVIGTHRGLLLDQFGQGVAQGQEGSSGA